VILHQDNAPAHTSQTTQLELDLLTASDSLKDGLPSRSSSAKLSLPSANLLCHLNINERLTLLCFSDCFRVKNEVRDVINGDRRLTVREVADKCGISKTTAHQILGNDLNMNPAHRLLTVSSVRKPFVPLQILLKLSQLRHR
jgi:AraC-like DNA-binding protein